MSIGIHINYPFRLFVIVSISYLIIGGKSYKEEYKEEESACRQADYSEGASSLKRNFLKVSNVSLAPRIEHLIAFFSILLRLLLILIHINVLVSCKYPVCRRRDRRAIERNGLKKISSYQVCFLLIATKEE